VAMAELQTKAFDPYHKWLGIRDSQSPPNHYRLLGLELWETDEDVIREAALRQSNHVRSFRSGPLGQICQKVLDELREARETLLDPDARKSYDRTLRKIVSASVVDPDQSAGSTESGLGRRSASVLSNSGPVECAKCGAENSSSRQFCGGCGVQLWEPCVECESLCGPGDLHCGTCGANVTVAVKRKIEELRKTLVRAQQHRMAHEHGKAIELLETVADCEHPKLLDVAENAGQLLRETQLELVEFRQRADLAFERAQQLCAGGEFQEAAELIRELPAPFTNHAMHSLLSEIESRQIEATDLGVEIRRRLAEQSIIGLLEKVERLLELQPDNVDAQKLLAKLRPLEEKRIDAHRAEMSRRAMVAVRAHRYAQATQCLEQIPEMHRTAEISKLLQQVNARANEVAWLTADLQGAAGFDEHLLPVARRLLKLQPDNDLAATCINKLEQRPPPNSQISSNGQTAWPSAPAKCAWGFPLTSLAAFDRLKPLDITCPEFHADPGRFSTAAGLALQALQRAAVAVNLAAPEKVGVLSLLKARKRRPTSAWGIDLGRGAIKAINLTLDAETGAPVVARAEFCESATAPFSANKDALDIDPLIDEFLKRVQLNDGAIAIGLPGEKVFTRFFNIPLIAKNKLGELMHYEVKQQIPFPLETLTWGYHLFEPADVAADSDASESAIGLFALKQEDAKAHLKPFADRGLKVDVLQSDAVALFNFIAFECLPLPPLAGRNADRIPVLAVLEIGAEKSNVVLSNGRTFWTRSIPQGGNDFTRTLQREFAFDWPKAEQLKRNPTSAVSLHRMYQPLQLCFEKFAAEVHHSIDQYLTQDPRLMVQRMLVTGGGLKLHGLHRFLQHGR
jgi:type IV pilus assembly protein PilM